MLAFITAAAMASQAAGNSRSAEPATDPGTWVNSNDYPADAVDRGIEGRTTFRLTIGTNGKVKSCMVTRSSGSSALDMQTCRSLTSNGLFRPALDKNGKPVEGKWDSSMRWNLPGAISFPFHSEQSTRVIMVQEKNGIISSCKLEGYNNPAVEEEVCKKTKQIFAWPEGYGPEADRKQIIYTLTETKDITILED